MEEVTKDEILRTAVHIRMDLEMRAQQAKRMLERLAEHNGQDPSMGMDLIDSVKRFQLAVLACDPKEISTRMEQMLKHPFAEYVEEKGLPKELENIGLARVQKNVLKGGGKKASFARKMMQRVKHVYDSMDEEDRAFLAKKVKKVVVLEGGKKKKANEGCNGDAECEEGLQCTRPLNGVCFVPKQLDEKCEPGRCDKRQNLVCSMATKKCVVRGTAVEMTVSDNFKPKISMQELQSVRKEGLKGTALLFLLTFVVLILYDLFVAPGNSDKLLDKLNNFYDWLFQTGIKDDVSLKWYRSLRKGGSIFTMVGSGIITGVLLSNPLTGLPATIGLGTAGGAGVLSVFGFADATGSVFEQGMVNIDYAGTNVRRTIFFARVLVLMFKLVETTYIAFKNSDALKPEETVTYVAEGLDVLREQVSSEWAIGKFVFLQALPTLLRSGRNVLGQLLNEQSKSLENMEKFRIQNKGETEVRKEAIKAAFSKKPRKKRQPPPPESRCRCRTSKGEQCMNKRKGDSMFCHTHRDCQNVVGLSLEDAEEETIPPEDFEETKEEELFDDDDLLD